LESKSLADSKDINEMDNEDTHSDNDIDNQICRSNLENCDEDFALDNSYDDENLAETTRIY
jgi:hypothetical protein